jgi:outer membrane protein TolC
MQTRLQVIKRLRQAGGRLKHFMVIFICASLATSTMLAPKAFAQSASAQQQSPAQPRQQTGPEQSGPRTPAQQNQQRSSSPNNQQPGSPQSGSQSQQPAQQNAPGGLQNVPATPGQSVGAPGVIVPSQLPQEPPQVAPNYQAPARALPPAERVGVDIANQVPLTLNDAIALALANNKDINASRIDVEIAGFDIRAAQGVYDPRITSGIDYNRNTTPAASFISGGADGSTTQNSLTGDVRLSGNSPVLGGNYLLDFTSGRSTTNNQFTALNPQYPSALTLTYTQPLLRGLRTDENRRRIEIARRNLTLSDEQFRQRVIETITRVQQAYWDLTFSLRNLQVQIDAVKQAQRQLESNQRQVTEGTLAPIDVTAAQTQVATFEQNVYAAQEAVTRAENNLKSLMLPDRKAPQWSRAIMPTSPVALEPPRIPLDQALATALTNRPELQQVATTAEINNINTRFFRDQTKPEVNLVASYSAVGLAGNLIAGGTNPFTAGNAAILARVNELSTQAGLPPLPPVTPTGTFPDFLVGGAGQSLTNLFGLNFPTTRVGITFTLPIGNRTAEANLGRSLAEGRRIQNQEEQLEQQIEVDVRNTLQAVTSAEARLQASAVARSSAEQLFESERRRLEGGLSTVFLVLQRQTELVAARGRELQAQTDLNRAIAEFQRATGSTLQVNNIVVQTDTPTRQLHQTAPTSLDAPKPR